MMNLCEGCKHEDEICFMIEFPCLEYEPKEEEEGEDFEGQQM